MAYDPLRPRLMTGTTLIHVWETLVKNIQSSGIVHESQVWPVMDDEVVPAVEPSQRLFLTVRFPSVVWSYGDVFAGSGKISEFLVQAQTRISVWMEKELDYYGKASHLLKKSLDGGPGGGRVISKLVKFLWDEDLVDDDDKAVLIRPLKFVSLEPPGVMSSSYKPWRLVVEFEFNWDLSLEV